MIGSAVNPLIDGRSQCPRIHKHAPSQKAMPMIVAPSSRASIPNPGVDEPDQSLHSCVPNVAWPSNATPPGGKPGTTGALTIDVEEWFHAHNLAVDPAEWNTLPSRIESQMAGLLELLDRAGVLATCFVLGWVARRHPRLVHALHAHGHEVACHGDAHVPIFKQAPATFAQDIRRAKDSLEDLIGAPVRGYRAPSYSITAETLWALDELEQAGFTYDSSIYPVRAPHGRYGMPGAPLGPHRIRPQLWEFPLPTVRLGGCRLPAATGAYLRLWPLGVTRLAFRQYRRLGLPVVVNVHPWELDPAQPRRTVSWTKRMLHYSNLAGTRSRLVALLPHCRWRRLDGWLRTLHETPLAPIECPLTWPASVRSI